MRKKLLNFEKTGDAQDAYSFAQAIHSAEFLCNSASVFVACGKKTLELRDTRDPEAATTGNILAKSSFKTFINAVNHPLDVNLIALCNRESDGVTIHDLRNPGRPLLSKFREADLTGVAWSPNG